MNPGFYTFIGGDTCTWSVTKCQPVTREPLPVVTHLDIINANVSALADGAQWMLRGATSNERYVTRDQKDRLVANQAALCSAGSHTRRVEPDSEERRLVGAHPGRAPHDF